MKTAAAYIRVSTDDQLEYSPDAQLKELKKYAKTHNLFLNSQYIYMDEGISGRNVKKREAFNKMIGTAKQKPKPFDVILLWKFSRFARNREDSIVYKSMLRKQCGIEVISITESIGDDKMSILIEALIEAMDEYYSINLAEEVKRGMSEKASRGEFQASPPFGYRKEAGKPLSILPEEAKYVKYIFDRYMEGETFFSIAGKLNAMGIKTKKGNPFENRQVEYILNNPIYKGYVRWTPEGKTVSKRIFDSPGTLIIKPNHEPVEPIIDEKTFDAVALKLKEKRAKKKPRERPSETKKHYLSGLLKCGSCGSTLTYQTANDGFQCLKYAHGTCKPSHFIKSNKIEKIVCDYLGQVCKPGVYVPSVRSGDMTDEIALIDKELAELEKMLDKAKQAYLAGIDTLADYGDNKKKIQTQMEQKKNTRSHLAPKESILNQDELKEKISDIRQLLLSNTLTIAQKNIALSSIIEKIEFSRPDETVTIYFYL